MFLFIYPGYLICFYAKISNYVFMQKYFVIYLFMLFFAIGLTNFKFVLTNEFIYFCLVLNNKASPVNSQTCNFCSYLSVFLFTGTADI